MTEISTKNMDKEEFYGIIDKLIKENKVNYHNAALHNDLDYALVFMSVYLGPNPVQVKTDGAGSTSYVLNSYDGTSFFSMVHSQKSISFQRGAKDNSVAYKTNYDLSEKKFITRTTTLKSFPLGIEQVYNETLYSNMIDGVFYAKTTEAKNEWEVVIFKHPEDDGLKNRIYYHYKVKDGVQIRKAKSSIKEVPYLGVTGITSLAEILSHHFEENTDMQEITDEFTFKRLAESAIKYYKNEKRLENLITLREQERIARAKMKAKKADEETTKKQDSTAETSVSKNDASTKTT